MDLYSFPPIAALLDGAHDLLIGLADLLEPLIGVASAAAAIVLVTLLVRAALIPVGVSQAKAEQGRARLAPKLAALQRRFAKQPERLQREMMALYRDEGTSPLAGCLPMLAQAPVVGVIYALFVLQAIAGHPNALLQHTLAGVPLGSSLAGMLTVGTLTPSALAVFAIVVVSIALVGETTRRVFRAPVSTAPPAGRVPGEASASPLANPAAVRMLGLLQYATAVVAMFVPLAAALYLLVTVAWTLGQRMVLRRAYPLPEPA
ncbi:membrane protein insertase YidC [Agromyces sp. S2-1-8]|uniref:YidC/Oxa1 family membrane protein insertase n=1 Tax=unclassified Agromyces TaxID=2639701 RepID=UPI001E2F0ED2|nr:membrane protein insertase YidC [Agromyces sp. S2-1-8]MCD5346177.1 YidC/Oxa1 family membrane protein insertase [Agromyces sp. S2-1-8]